MRIAVVDDDPEMASFVRQAMRDAGHSCDEFHNGAKFLAALRRDTYDLLLLDWDLPDTTGFDLLRRIRDDQADRTGIIMLTNQSDKDAIARALQSGADDYVVKPESAHVIAARAEAVNRRVRQCSPSGRYTIFQNYSFDHLTGEVSIAGESIAVNNKEFSLALLFFENLHRPLSRSYLLEAIWRADPNLPTRTLDMHVSRIRTKLRLRPEYGFRIASVAGYGYRMERFVEAHQL